MIGNPNAVPSARLLLFLLLHGWVFLILQITVWMLGCQLLGGVFGCGLDVKCGAPPNPKHGSRVLEYFVFQLVALFGRLQNLEMLEEVDRCGRDWSCYSLAPLPV